MGVFLSQLVPGMVLKTGIGEKYMYLGYYKGTLRSAYYGTDEGYLYMYMDNADFGHGEDADKLAAEAEIFELSKMSVDGFGCYTKQPKAFSQICFTIDISGAKHTVEHIYGLTRIGDRKPLKGRFKKEDKA